MPLTPQKSARLKHLAAKVHAFELLREIEAGADLLSRLERYARLSPDIVTALDADRMPPCACIVGGVR